MDNSGWLIAFLIFAVLAGVVSFGLIYLLHTIRMNQKDAAMRIDELYSKLQEEVRLSVAPNFINLSPSTDDFVNFAIEAWRLKQKLSRLENLSESQRKGVDSSIDKILRYFDRYDVEVVDYTGKKFNDGLNLDVLSKEKDLTIDVPKVKETVEPTVLYRGQVVRKGKIIVATNES